LVVGFAVLGAGGGVAAAEVPNPTAEGPVEGGTHGYPWNHSLVPLSGDGYDYTEREFFYGGTATNLTSGATAPYKSRMLVRLPSDPAKFTGIVVVEWLNVTASYDLETGWPTPGPEWLMRQGVGYVGVSAQLVGVCCGQGSLKGWDPPRYAPLVHPGDDFSYDIFSQAVEALRDPANNGAPGADPMSGLPAKKIVATGASQSASRLTDFVNDGYDRDTIDLFLITRGGGPYTDFSTPIFMLNEENNEIPQPDSPQLVGWEEAGTAHAPKHWEDYADATAERDLAAPSPLAAVAQQCSINRGSVDYSSRAMSYWVKEYLEKGTLPPSAPRMRRDESGGLVRDDNGLAQGGLRHPFIEVPVAFNSGEGCVLWGEYREWEPEKIRSMYPTHCEYVSRVTEWANHEVEKGWLLPEDRDDAIAKAVAFGDPWPNEPLDACRGAAVAAAQAPPAAGQPPSPPARPCAGTGLGIRGTRVGPAALGRRRRAQRRKIGLRRSRSRRRYDVYCAGSPDRLRIAYAPRRLGRKLRGRAVVVLTANPLIAADGVAPRANEETLRRQLVGERRIRVGRTTWYLGRRGAARLVYRVRLGRVVEVGVANRRLFAKPRSARRTLRVLGL
jgi:hypothetical protein